MLHNERKFTNPYNNDQKRVERSALAGITTPRPIDRWAPMAHNVFVDMLFNQAKAHGIEIIGEDHCVVYNTTLEEKPSRYFGMFWVARDGRDDTVYTIGARNSHDKRFAASIAAGQQVMVCDNLCFDGDIVVGRKNTTNIMAEIGGKIDEALANILKGWNIYDERTGGYEQQSVLHQRDFDTLVMSLKRAKAIGTNDMSKIEEHWNNPPHAEFAAHNVYNLMQACTEVWKGESENARLQLSPRTSAMFKVFDAFVAAPDKFNRTIEEVIHNLLHTEIREEDITYI